MKCRICRQPAGFLVRTCHDCKTMLAAISRLEPGTGFRGLLDALVETGISEQKVRFFLAADVNGQGSLQDRLTARMTNELSEGLGQPSAMTPKDVHRIRGEGSAEK